LGDLPLGQKGDPYSLIQKETHNLVGNRKDFRVGLEAVGGGIHNYPGRYFSFPSQLFLEEFWQVSVKLYCSFGWGLAVSSGITIDALK
jgi:hypothetical protein